MEIKTLVIFGFILVVVSSGIYVYLNQNNLNRWMQQLILFNASKKNEIAQIDTNIKHELKNTQPEVDEKKLKQELKTLIEKKSVAGNEVFLVSNNIFSKDDAPKVCRGLFNSNGATKEQLEDGYNNGANWCNYGWTVDGNALYPLQNRTNTPDCKGEKGLNGGKVDARKDYKLGAICYGMKPDEKKYTELEKIYQESNFSEGDMKMLEEYRKKLKTAGGVKILPFNNKAWSRWDKNMPTQSTN